MIDMMEQKTILIVDDENMMREAVASYLEKQGYHVLQAETGTQALSLLEKETVSFVILDLMLPDISGEEICSRIRRQSRIPIIMLTAKTMEDDRSDHDLKPLAEKFSWNAGDLVIDYNRKEVLKKGETISLTPIEWKILSAFTRYPQKVFTRDELIASAFDTDFSGYDRVIDTHIKNLRKKIEDDPKNPIYLCTVHGIGYKFGGNIQ